MLGKMLQKMGKRKEAQTLQQMRKKTEAKAAQQVPREKEVKAAQRRKRMHRNPIPYSICRRSVRWSRRMEQSSQLPFLLQKMKCTLTESGCRIPEGFS